MVVVEDLTRVSMCMRRLGNGDVLLNEGSFANEGLELLRSNLLIPRNDFLPLGSLLDIDCSSGVSLGRCWPC